MSERVLLAPCSDVQSVHTDIIRLGSIAAHVSADRDDGPGWRVSGGAGLVVSFDFHDAVAARIANEFLYAPTCLRFDTVLVITDPGNQSSC
jgi:phenylpropionate dioxygenase-like ring-hydroxylating dioxygenase large terminal subunit